MDQIIINFLSRLKSVHIPKPTQAFYGGVPGFITQKVMQILDKDLRKITSIFMELYCKT